MSGLSGVSSVRALTLAMRLCPQDLMSSHRPHLLIPPNTLGARIPPREPYGDTDILTMADSKGTCDAIGT